MSVWIGPSWRRAIDTGPRAEHAPEHDRCDLPGLTHEWIAASLGVGLEALRCGVRQ